MAPKQELTFIAGIAVLAFGLGHVIRWQLLAVCRASEVTSEEISKHEPNQKTKDAKIKLETLDELSRNANDEIRNVAIKIIIDRISKSSCPYMLLRELGSESNERRDRALTSIKYLLRAVPDCFDEYKYTAVQSLVKCLSYLVPLSRRFELALAAGKEIHRTETERDALELMYLFLIRFGVQLALDCNIFGLWLSRYPFGGDLETQYPGDKDSRFMAENRLVNGLSYRDPTMFRIINLILTDDTAIGEPCACSAQHDGNPHDDEQGFSEAWDEVYGHGNAPSLELGPMMRRGRRVPEESIEEQALRRRRREAMVLGELGRPIESEDIIQRVGT